MEHHIHEVLIIGAGPCGLAVAARLRERTPSALFTDSEHQRYHWMKSSSSSRRNSKPTKTSRRPTASDRLLCGSSVHFDNDHGRGIDICVLDATSNKWMSAWNESFESFKISHLRSPMFFHPDPSDRDGLLGYTYAEGREKELKEIAGVVGKSLSKYQRKKGAKKSSRAQETVYLDERSRPDYYRPSATLFKSYCTDVTCRYNLSSIVEKSEVKAISYCSESSIFTLQTSTGIKKARIVIFAAGPAMQPILPLDCPFHRMSQGSCSHVFDKSYAGELPNHIFPTHLLRKVSENKETNVIVVGGGLSSAQVCALLSNLGVTKVWHLMRGSYKVKHFDLDLSWIGKYKNFQLASFWSADSDEERLEMLKEARGGGSITPEYKKIIQDLISKGKVELQEHIIISEATWSAKVKIWTIQTEPRKELPGIDHVIYSTGFAPDWNNIPAIQPLLRDYPISTVGGMPCLTNDLMWNDEVPFFVTGRLAGLRVGPGAGNLEGARQGSERIAWKVGELLQNTLDRSESYWEHEVDQRCLGLGIENQFGALSE